MKFCVIGLGRLGHQVATVLAENGMEVMAVDSNESIVASIRDHVTQAICMRVTDEHALRSIGIEEIDTVIVAVGENFAQSILLTALLKKRIKTPTVITRAINDIHKEILQIVGADEVILPEKQMGTYLADKLSSPIPDLARITKDFSITKFTAPQSFVGKTVVELGLSKKYNVYCIGLETDDEVTTVHSDYVIQEGDKLIFSGKNSDLEKISKI